MSTDDGRTRSRLGGRVIVCDGAMGTMLHAAGVPLDHPLCEVNLSAPHLVRDLHAAYVAAGAGIIQTNTFDANRVRLERGGLAGSVAEINIAGARLAREAVRDSGRAVLVAGSVGPVIGHHSPGREARAQRDSVLAEQIAALNDWVDLIMLETFGDLASLVRAVGVAGTESDLPVVAQMTFSTDGRTLAGEDPATVAATLADLDVAAIGANCTVGPAALRDVVTGLAEHGHHPVSVQPNAGLPVRLGRRLRYAHNIAYFAEEAAGFVARGATLVGGCCGTTPAHIRAIAEAVAGLEPPARPERVAPGTQGETVVRITGDDQRRRLPPAWPHPEEFVVAVGLHAPRGQDLAEFMAGAERFVASGITMFAITDPAPPAARVNPIGAAVLLRERLGAQVVLSVETADRTLAALQADLLGAHALGIDIVLCRTGTPRVAGGYPEPDSLWGIDSERLVGALAGLNDGVDWRGVTAPERTGFVIGAAVHTAAADEAGALERAEDKIRAGGHFLVTDTVYDVAAVERRLSRLRERVDVPVLVAVPAVGDPGTAARLAHEVPEVSRHFVAAAGRSRDGDDLLRHAVLAVEKLRHLAAGVLVPAPEPADPRVVELAAALRTLGSAP